MLDSPPKQLHSAAEVIDALGGTRKAALLAGYSRQNPITNARARGNLPYSTFLIFSRALAKRGLAASPALWGIKPAPSEEERRDGQ